MLAVIVALTIGFQNPPLAGVWTVDQNIGLGRLGTRYEMPLDWEITLKPDGKYEWRGSPNLTPANRRVKGITSRGTHRFDPDERKLVLTTTDLVVGMRSQYVFIVDGTLDFFTYKGKWENDTTQWVRFRRVPELPKIIDGGTGGGSGDGLGW